MSFASFHFFLIIHNRPLSPFVKCLLLSAQIGLLYMEKERKVDRQVVEMFIFHFPLIPLVVLLQGDSEM